MPHDLTTAATGNASTQTRQLSVRLARTGRELVSAMQLRLETFYDDYHLPVPAGAEADADRYDARCDHLIVVDERADIVVGYYRLITPETAKQVGGYYNEEYFDLTPLMQRGGRILELGRSCIQRDYRDGRVLALLWQGIADYMRDRQTDMLFGRVGFHGIDLALHAESFSLLYHYHLGSEAERPRVRAEKYIPMHWHSRDAIEPRRKALFHGLPPLVKGYIRVGGWLADGVFSDSQLQTMDVGFVLPLTRITSRYRRHFLR